MLERSRPASRNTDEVIVALGLRPHPEGGWFVETWREPAGNGERSASSAIYYMLRAGERSHWHRIDATEVWHFYAGERPQVVVPAGARQAARSLGAWTLVGCTVAPAFRFEGLDLAPSGWEPGRDPR